MTTTSSDNPAVTDPTTSTTEATHYPTTDREHDSKFYAQGIPEIPELMVDILTKYSGIPREGLEKHVSDVRDRAYAIYKYPCIGRYRFLTFSLVNHPLYESYVLPTLLGEKKSDSKEESLFVDIGTCLGQDLRALLHAGVPKSRIWATDVESEFIPIGYDLFRDQGRFPVEHQLTPVNLFDGSEENPVNRLDGKVTILHIAAVFHLFGYEDQVEIARRVLKLLRQKPGSLILGSQTAHKYGREYPQRPGGRGENLYRHSEKTWDEMWEKVAQEVGVKLKLKTEFRDDNQQIHGIKTGSNDKGGHADDPDFTWMRFEVWLE